MVSESYRCALCRAADDYWTISKTYARVRPVLTKVLIRQDSPEDTVGLAIGSDSLDERTVSAQRPPPARAARALRGGERRKQGSRASDTGIVS